MMRTAVTMFDARVAASAERLALQDWTPEGLVHGLTWKDWHARSREVAAALVASGVEPGARVAVLAANSTLWPVVEMGVLGAGCVSVGIYPTSAVPQIATQLTDSGARAIIVDTPAQFERALEAIATLPDPPFIVAPQRVPGTQRPGVFGWEPWVALGATALGDPSILRDLGVRQRAVQPDDDAFIVYTSGSTGEPKGARLSHRYAVASAESVVATLALTDADSTLSILPYSHAGEQIFGLFTRIASGMAATHVADYSRMWEACRTVQPTLFGGLPRFFEKAYDALLEARARLDDRKAEAWDAAIRDWTPASPIPALIRDAVHALFGSRMRLVTSGGAALPVRVAEYLERCGVTVLGAYGQTESICIAFNQPGRHRHDAVGVPMPGTTIEIAADSELLVRRGPLTFSGYHGRPRETAEAFTADGQWLKTGDLGELDADGFLRVIGRKKELIALSNGKKVAPLAIERVLVEQPPIGHAVLHGEGRPYVTALIALRDSYVDTWRSRRGPNASYADAAGDATVRAAVAASIEAVNRAFSRPEQVRRFVLVTQPFSVEAGELTPTMKVRRDVVLNRYRAELEALYQKSA